MEIHTQMEIKAPATAVWEVFGERFAEVSQWSDAVLESSVDRPLDEGAVRTCKIDGFGPFPPGFVTEELTTFDRTQYLLNYTVTSGTPPILASVVNRWAIEQTSDGCRIASHATFELNWWAKPLAPFLRGKLTSGLESFVVGLRDYVEMDANAAAA